MKRSSLPRACALALSLGVVLAAPAEPANPAPAEADEPRQVAFAAWQIGNVLHMLGRYEEAAEKFRESIAAYPTAEGHTFLGWSLSALGHLEEAIAECQFAIELDPDYGNPYNDIGVYLYRLGRSDEAVPWLEKAMRAERYCCPQFPHFNLGRIQLQRGDVERARRSFNRALEHDPSYTPAILALEFLDRQGLRGL